MANRVPTDVRQQAHAILEAWKEMNLPTTIGEITPTALEQDLTALGPIESQLNTAEAQLTDLRNKRDSLSEKIWDQVKRVRAGVKANYGDDSSQYEMVGGTRRSERKRPTRKTKAA